MLHGVTGSYIHTLVPCTTVNLQKIVLAFFEDLLYIASSLKIKAKLMELFNVVSVTRCTVEPV